MPHNYEHGDISAMIMFTFSVSNSPKTMYDKIIKQKLRYNLHSVHIGYICDFPKIFILFHNGPREQKSH